MVPLSVLDLSPVLAGVPESHALRHTLELAQAADRLGYRRYWLAEHHSIASVVSTAPEILIGHVADRTARIRVGAGGIMLPNHSPLHIAEVFRVLEALHPGRIDLGLGRAPGSNSITALALRRSRGRLAIDDFPESIDELIGYGENHLPADHPYASVRAMPTDAPLPPLWILGSTEDGAAIAASKGLGFAFAHHINPDSMLDASRVYRERFQASKSLSRPAMILAIAAICAGDAAQAQRLAATTELSWLRLRTGQPAPLESSEAALAYPYTPMERQIVKAARRHFVAGDPASVREQVTEWVAMTGADEVMVTTMLYEPRARLRSYELLAEAFGLEADPRAQR
jgi:luciferase family oxidoreductase group 1